MLKKCSRCEVNYVRNDDELCDMCKKLKYGAFSDDEVVLCNECNEFPAVKGEEICAACMRRRKLSISHASSTTEEPIIVDDKMDLEVEIVNDIPENELKEIVNELLIDTDEEDEDEDEINDKKDNVHKDEGDKNA